MNRNRMDCSELPAALLLAADDELGPDELMLMEAHLAGCAGCRAQQALFHETDRRLVECGELLDALHSSGPTPRSQEPERLVALKHKNRVPWLGRVRGWQWAAVALAGCVFAAVAVWTGNFQRPAERRAPDQARFTQQSFSNVELSDDTAEVVQVELPLSPLGNPFLDDSQAESVVLADVVVGSDGLAKDIRLAN